MRIEFSYCFRIFCMLVVLQRKLFGSTLQFAILHTLAHAHAHTYWHSHFIFYETQSAIKCAACVFTPRHAPQRMPNTTATRQCRSPSPPSHRPRGSLHLPSYHFHFPPPSPPQVTPRANTHRTQQAKICVLFWIFSHFLWVCVCMGVCTGVYEYGYVFLFDFSLVFLERT